MGSDASDSDAQSAAQTECVDQFAEATQPLMLTSWGAQKTDVAVMQTSTDARPSSSMIVMSPLDRGQREQAPPRWVGLARVQTGVGG